MAKKASSKGKKESRIITLNERGGLTLRKEDREAFGQVYLYIVKDRKIVLEPVQTREEFFAELDAAEKEWEETGISYSLDDMKKRYKLT